MLVVYATTEGQTRKIAERIGALLKDLGHSADVRDAACMAGPIALEVYEGVMVGASVHQGHHQSAARQFVCAHRAVLDRMPSAFFSVSLAAASPDLDDRRGAEQWIEEFATETGWRPILTRSIAGALRYTEYDFLKRWILKLMMRHEGGPTDTSKDYELTDWDEVTRFAGQFAELCAGRALSWEIPA
jgi:menaquinone-dependent protoporphyrinogen oxidase